MIPTQVGPAPTMQQPQPLGMPFTPGPGQQLLMSPHPGMVVQQPIPGCPRGLEVLAQSDQLVIQQQLELLEAFTGFEQANKYMVSTAAGQPVYWAAEQSSCCNRNCCGPSRSFRMSVVDGQQSEVLSMQRPLKCSCCCCWCCLQQLEVSAGGVLLGTVTQEFSVLYPRFSVRGPDGDVRLQIHGPCCVCKCCADVEFPVMSADGGRQVGVLTKQWGGMSKEVFTDAKTFGVTFPQALDPATKATLFGAAFLLGYIFFERKNNN